MNDNKLNNKKSNHKNSKNSPHVNKSRKMKEFEDQNNAQA